LAREQSLRDLLRDPAARAKLLTALEPAPPRRFWTWRPIAAVAAMATIATIAVVVARRPERTVLVGQVLPPVNPVVRSEPATTQPTAPAVPAPKPRRKAAASQPVPAPPSAPAAVSGAIVEVPKVVAEAAEAPRAKAEQRVDVSAAAPMPPPVLTTRTNLVAADSPAAPVPQTYRISAPGARQIFFGVAQRTAATFSAGANAFQPASLALRYTILRRDASGAFVEVDRADLSASDTVELRFTASTTGYLTVGDATPVSLTAMEPYTTAPLSTLPAELKIIFAPQPQRQASSAAAITEVQYRDTYVANRVPGQPLTYTIKLP
jgi:hypothetical protein